MTVNKEEMRAKSFFAPEAILFAALLCSPADMQRRWCI
jgi:hypothetical protein